MKNKKIEVEETMKINDPPIIRQNKIDWLSGLILEGCRRRGSLFHSIQYFNARQMIRAGKMIASSLCPFACESKIQSKLNKEVDCYKLII